MKLQIKRAYDPPDESDGIRILVDRVWPRGITKEKLQADHWLRDIAPSTELRKWFGHDPAKWGEFRRRYEEELAQKSDLLGQIMEQLKHSQVTLVYGAKDEEHNQAVVLQEVLTSRLKQS
jgi:uncharacterized protein YeaO (DUF488 family)